MIKVLIVEDSPVVKELLNYILASDADIEVIGMVGNGEEALKFITNNKPDVVTMDIHMPKMDGYEASRRIMETNPMPIVIVSASWDPKEVTKTFQAMEVGALIGVETPTGVKNPYFDVKAKDLIKKVKLMSEVKVIRRWPKNKIAKKAAKVSVHFKQPAADIKIVVIGASTGGPPALKTILSGLTKEFPVPVLIVQHIGPDFLHGFVDWLDQVSGIPIRIADNNELVLAGQGYIVPDGFSMKITERNKLVLTKDGQINGLYPSVSRLFYDTAELFGPKAIGVLLTGMGKDGAKELKLMKDRGAITIAQDMASSVVHGMPGAAIKLGAASYVLSVDKIAPALNNLVVNVKSPDDFSDKKVLSGKCLSKSC